jgi:hypothetical protein
MVNEDQKTIVTAVIALLNGIDVDGETMEHILDKVGMADQMKSQLGTKLVPPMVIDQIAEDIVADLDNEGIDLIEDQEYGIVHNEISLTDITYDKYRMNKIITHVLESHFLPIDYSSGV